MTEWNEHRLGEVCSRLSSGSNITAKDIHESGSFPVFGGNGTRGYAEEANFSGECAIIGRQGAYCGNVRYFIGEARMSEHAVVACAGPGHSTRFLTYLLLHMNLGKLSGQAAQPGLSVKVLSQQSVRMPSRQHQERIAEILGAYDDLIEVNRRRIAVLEEMARGLFEEWFVRFRFPGHEAVPILDTQDGPLPEGWSFTPLNEWCSEMRSGSTPSRQVEEYWEDGDIDWFTTGELWDCFLHGSKERVNSRAVTGRKARLFEPDTILMAIYGSPTVGRLGVTTNRCSTNQAALGMRPDTSKAGLWLLYFTLFGLRAKFNSLAQGAAQQNISKEKVAQTRAKLPDFDLVEKFETLIDPMMRLVERVQRSNARLTASRNLLLPRLVSGDLSIAGAERQLEEAA